MIRSAPKPSRSTAVKPLTGRVSLAIVPDPLMLPPRPQAASISATASTSATFHPRIIGACIGFSFLVLS